jgi:hypothetical protein
MGMLSPAVLLGRRVLAAAALALLIAAPAQAVSLAFNFSGFTLPDDDTGIMPDVTIVFDFDPGCSLNCTLKITLTYNDVNGSSGLTTGQQALTGVSWDPVGSITVNPASSSVIAPTLVGSQASTAQSDLPDLTLDSVSGDDVSGHWAFRDDLENAQDSSVPAAWNALGNFLLHSVGDISYNGVKAEAAGMEHLLPGTISSVEPMPPDGIPFGIVDPDTTDVAGTNDTALAQSSSTAFLNYDGTLDGIEHVLPHFGTDGVVPEPATALLFGSGLVGLAFASRRRR